VEWLQRDFPEPELVEFDDFKGPFTQEIEVRYHYPARASVL
jgi:hypothetical protein